MVAPVLNLSNRDDWDPLKVTDALASELQSFPGIAVIPVNRTLAALAGMGKSACESPDDAHELARRFGATATVVAAVTEFDPYDPPRLGLILQWYDASPDRELMSAAQDWLPAWQVQRTFDASHESVQRELRDYDRARESRDSPYGAATHTKSQELFARFCMWSAIVTMQEHRAAGRVARARP